MNERIELALIDCLDALDAGESLEQVLARYPQDAEALRPMLETAAMLPALSADPRPAAQMASRRSFLNMAHEQRPARRGLLGMLPMRLSLGLAALAVALLSFGGGAVAASGALPGDPLYGLKRTVESVQLAVAPDRERVARSLDAERRDEVERLMAARRSGDVTFRGTIEIAKPAGVRVSGIDVQIDSSTAVAGPLAVGAVASVTGRIEDGVLRGVTVTVDQRSVPPATATPRPTRTPSPTATPRPTNTATARPTSTPSPTAPPTATQTAAPTRIPPTRIPPTRVPPTAVPPTAAPPDDNSNSNGGDDNGNDNGGGGDDNSNDNGGGGDDNSNDNGGGGGDDNSNDNGGNDNSNDNGGGGNDNSNDNGGGGGDDNSNDNGGGSDNSGSGNSGGSDNSGGGSDDD